MSPSLAIRDQQERNTEWFESKQDLPAYYGGHVENRASPDAGERDTSEAEVAHLDGFDVRGERDSSAAWTSRLRAIKPVIPPTAMGRRFGRFVPLETFEGTIIEVDGAAGTLLCRVTSTLGQGPAEDVELMLDEVSELDRALIREGAMFYWSIGYFDEPSGQRSRRSFIRFRRFPNRRDVDTDAVESRVTDLRRKWLASGPQGL